MTRTQLEDSLAAIGVHTNSYCLDGVRHSDCVCVGVEDGKWRVFYVERNMPDELGVFDTVEAAYEFVYATFCKWLGIKN
ncbi:hypothetical protein [Herbaspirillum sp. B65]|uniref:hypothetical protein n=1 Tax=Herbaspirillum sp. B65 TaxID=137708 RepID=UPI0011D25FEF|nr:hypothetical protein [Herbaspirillum sp. B65]